MRSFMLLLSLASCVASHPVTQGEDRVATALASRVAGQPRACISVTTSGEGLTIIDGRTLFYNKGGTLWVNRLERDCPGIRPFATLIVETYGGQHCRGDRVRAVESGSSIPGAACVLGDFTPYRPN